MKKDKRHLQRLVQTIDYKTGELIEEKKDFFIQKEKEPNFVKMYTNYIDSISLLMGLPSYATEVLLCITDKMTFDNIFSTTKPIRELLAKETNLSINSVNMAISILKKKNILISPEKTRGYYLVNPNLFAKGSYEYIKEIKMFITFKDDGTVFLKSDFPEKIKEIKEKYGFK
jgi:gp23